MAPKKDVRELLLSKATERFAEKGYAETTTKEIAKAAKVNSALLYYYFKNKNEMLFIIIERATFRLYDILKDIQSRDMEPVERLKEMIGSYVRYVTENYHKTKIVNESTDKLTGYQKKQSLLRQRKIYDMFSYAIKSINKKNCIKREISPQVVNLVTMGMINWCPLWYKKDGPLSLEEVIEQMTSVLFFGMLGQK